MNKNKHLLLWSSLGTLALLVAAAVQENYLRPWRQIQAAARTETGPVDVHLRQIVVPALRATDRCVTCHLGMAPGEPAVDGHPVLAAHKPVVHDPSRFGCTVCHGGQGRATEKDDAHGRVPYWPVPMLPLEYAEAGCGTCHTHLRVPNASELARGRNLMERHDCLACHRVDGRGGTLRPGFPADAQGPDLSGVGVAGFDPQWYEKHLSRWETHQDGPWKTSFGPLEPHERAAIEVHLSSRAAAPRLVEAKALFHSLGCQGCHKVGGVGGDDGPDLTHIGQRDPARLDFTHVRGPKTLANWLAEHFRNPPRVVPGSQMPALGLSQEQIDLLALATLALRRSDVPEAYWPQDRLRAERLGQREFATDGATLFGTFCAACHGQQGEGRRYPGMPPFPAVGNADFLAAAPDAFLMESIRRGRPGRRMPAWGEKEGGLRPEEITRIVAYLREQAGVPEPEPLHTQRRWVQADAQTGQDLYGTHCAGCHGPQGEGTDAPALRNAAFLAAATDDYLVETIGRGRRGTPMPPFRSGTPAYPALTPAQIESLVAYLRSWEKSP